MREILIEYERVQIIRKRARTSVEYCPKCCEHVDFISLLNAAEVFTTSGESLVHFMNVTNSHFQSERNGELKICLKSLLQKMDEEKDRLVRHLPAKA